MRLPCADAYLDRADDLIGYAKIYEAKHAVVAKDTKYKPTHVADARRLAGEIIAALSNTMSPKAREEYDLLRRAWTLLSKMYVELALSRSGKSADEVVVVGDTIWDIISARRAGLPTIALLTGGGYCRAELQECGAIAVYRDCADLRAALESHRWDLAA
jgi:hypothetical protein